MAGIVRRSGPELAAFARGARAARRAECLMPKPLSVEVGGAPKVSTLRSRVVPAAAAAAAVARAQAVACRTFSGPTTPAVRAAVMAAVAVPCAAEANNSVNFSEAKREAISVLSKGHGLLSDFPAFADDKDVFMAAASTGNLAYASTRLRQDREAVMKSVSQHNGGGDLANAAEIFHDDREIVLAAVCTDGRALRIANERLRRDREVAYRAILSNGDAIQFLAGDLRTDDALITYGLANCKRADTVKYIEPKFRKSETHMLVAVGHHGRSLEHASEELKKNPMVVRTALHNDPAALEFADFSFQDDKDWILYAVSQREPSETIYPGKPKAGARKAMKYASLRWRQDREFAREIYAVNPGALDYFDDSLDSYIKELKAGNGARARL